MRVFSVKWARYTWHCKSALPMHTQLPSPHAPPSIGYTKVSQIRSHRPQSLRSCSQPPCMSMQRHLRLALRTSVWEREQAGEDEEEGDAGAGRRDADTSVSVSGACVCCCPPSSRGSSEPLALQFSCTYSN